MEKKKMLKKNAILGCAACVALAIAVSPASAQSRPQYPDRSLPWERMETSQLNAQQAAMPGIILSMPVQTTTRSVPVTQDEWVAIYPRGYKRLVIIESTGEPSLRGVPVMDAMGNMVGNFRHLTMQDGVPESIIALNNQKTVAVPDHDLRYDPLANTVVADLTDNQLDSMPARS
jgi:hypothetical protein